MTPLPKHLEEMRLKIADDHGTYCAERAPDRYSSGQTGVSQGFDSCFDLMLKDLESMAKALEIEMGDSGTRQAEEALKNYREKYGGTNE